MKPPFEARIQAANSLHELIPFMGIAQRKVLRELCRETIEEHEFFKEKIVEYAERIRTMPKIYEQDGKGDSAIVYLHYFTPSADWWITERDCSKEQYQAFGLADLGYGGELGYISIAELIANGAELDLYFNPRPLAEVKGGIQS